MSECLRRRGGRARSLLPQFAYEALDVTKMELPPGWRGYGARDYIDHPDTPMRQAQVDAGKPIIAIFNT